MSVQRQIGKVLTLKRTTAANFLVSALSCAACKGHVLLQPQPSPARQQQGRRPPAGADGLLFIKFGGEARQGLRVQMRA